MIKKMNTIAAGLINLIVITKLYYVNNKLNLFFFNKTI